MTQLTVRSTTAEYGGAARGCDCDRGEDYRGWEEAAGARGLALRPRRLCEHEAVREHVNDIGMRVDVSETKAFEGDRLDLRVAGNRSRARMRR